MFFTTVGVIASTTYARVPGEIRGLFVRERTSVIYVRNVAVALLVGLALLTMPLVAHCSPHGLTVLLFAVLTAFSVLSLVISARGYSTSLTCRRSRSRCATVSPRGGICLGVGQIGPRRGPTAGGT